jgi:trimeric autotransporter adhesin
MKSRNFIIFLALGFFALLQKTQAVSPAPDGGYPGQNTAEGQSALLHLAGGTYNTALGWASLGFNVTANYNTAIGAGALLDNTAEQNTATGAGALFGNTTGANNMANGAFALFSNTTGNGNTAAGDEALFTNTSGSFNTANGGVALGANITGDGNTAIGSGALFNNTGSNNTALGNEAGSNLTSGNNNVYIGAGVEGFAGDDGVCRIGSIYGESITNGSQIFINADNRLGTSTSSKRFKQNITPTSRASEVLYELKPVTFQYKKEIDPEGRWQFGLVAEDVEKVTPDLVVRDKDGKPYSVRYDQVNAMLLNEFLKEHRKVERLEATVARQQQGMEALAAQVKEQDSKIQKISDEAQLSRPAPRMVLSNP